MCLPLAAFQSGHPGRRWGRVTPWGRGGGRWGAAGVEREEGWDDGSAGREDEERLMAPSTGSGAEGARRAVGRWDGDAGRWARGPNAEDTATMRPGAEGLAQPHWGAWAGPFLMRGHLESREGPQGPRLGPRCRGAGDVEQGGACPRGGKGGVGHVSRPPDATVNRSQCGRQRGVSSSGSAKSALQTHDSLVCPGSAACTRPSARLQGRRRSRDKPLPTTTSL